MSLHVEIVQRQGLAVIFHVIRFSLQEPVVCGLVDGLRVHANQQQHIAVTYLKKFLAGQRLRYDEDTKHVLQKWVKGLAANFFEEGKQKLVPRYDKGLNFMDHFVQ
jgi:hypothetical protein